jgi:hypothetical protein
MVRIKGTCPGWRMAVSRAQTRAFLHPGYPNTYDRNSFFRKHVGVLYLLVKIHKTLKVRDKEG